MIKTLWFILAVFAMAVARPTGPRPTADAQIEGVEPALAPPPADQVQSIAREIGLKLRCPVCQGLSVADSTSPAALQMQRLVRDLVAQGYSEAQIDAYFRSRYGEWILLAPPTGGLHNVIWLAPLGLGLIGLSVMIGVVGRSRRQESPGPANTPSQAPTDDYTQRLLDEVDE